MDKFDLSDLQDIKDITKKKIAISNFKQGDDMKKQENNKIIFWTRTLTSISACLIFSCGIVFSKTIFIYGTVWTPCSLSTSNRDGSWTDAPSLPWGQTTCLCTDTCDDCCAEGCHN